MIRVLIISNSEWDDSNNFGSSFSNIFGGIDELTIANIYTRRGVPNTKTVQQFFNINESSLLQNLLNKKKPSGRVFKKEEEPIENNTHNYNNYFLRFIKSRRWIVFFMIRDLIWFLGRWKSKELTNFIDEFNPDLIFLPIYYSIHINKLGLFVKNYTKKPMIGYISDENYTLKQFSLSPLYWIDRLIKRKWVKKAILNTQLLYVISEKQKEDYDEIFNIESKIMYKGGDFLVAPPVYKLPTNTIELIYTGNIGDDRWRSLLLIAKSLCKIEEKINKKAILHIYSQTVFTSGIMKQFKRQKNLIFHGAIDVSKIRKIQLKADILVHVESLKIKEKLQSRHSFSTKIVDYLNRNRAIFAYGWEHAASIEYLKKNDAAIIATSNMEVEIQLERVIQNPKLLMNFANKAWVLGKRNHKIENIQKQLLDDFKSIIKIQ